MTLQGLYYEDLAPGQRYVSSSRTVTEADLTNFSMLSGDWHPIHSDEIFAASTPYGHRLVHGIFGLAMLTGLMDRAGWFSQSAIAMAGIEEWTFHAPVFVGDTLKAQMEIDRLRTTAAGDRGIVWRRFALINQRDEVVQSGVIPMLIARRPVDESGTFERNHS